MLTNVKPAVMVMSASPVKGPADLEAEWLADRARVATEAAQKRTAEETKMKSKNVTPSKNEMLEGLQALNDDDMLGWTEVESIIPVPKVSKLFPKSTEGVPARPPDPNLSEPCPIRTSHSYTPHKPCPTAS